MVGTGGRMAKKRHRLPDYVTIVGEGTEVAGGVRFIGGMHIDGTVVGDVTGRSEDGCALTLGRSGTIQGNIDVAHVVLDGAVIGDVRASQRAELASGARIEGDLYYGDLVMAVGAKVNGKLLTLDQVQALHSGALGVEEEHADATALPAEAVAVSSVRGGEYPDDEPSPRNRNT